MKKTVINLTIIAALVLSLTACGNAPAAESETPAAAPQVTENAQAAPSDTAEPQIAPAETDEPMTSPVRQDGERFEDVILIEGMEETVNYEHIKNETLGFEMDYDYELLERRSEADRECFLSVWDDPENPENYLELRADTGNAELVADAISATLSEEYEVQWSTREFDRVGSCIYLEASVIKNTNRMSEQMQAVYIIPTSDGCLVATAHCYIAESEGFSRRFAYMLNTLSVID